ncbi:MAG: hypothetical protein JWO89_1920 [Verrucomicrobiaceae bacterium]|nr:hypothetical protein [Verrucomicrobiaceae bacterium]
MGEHATIQSSGTGIPITPAVNFAALRSTVPESVGTARILITIDPAPAIKITISLHAAGAPSGTASPLLLTGKESDVTLPSPLNIVFNPGETRKFLTIKVTNELRDEVNETLQLSLADPVSPRVPPYWAPVPSTNSPSMMMTTCPP